MKKKNLIILLLIPFIISLLGIVTINISINTFYGDISSIEWEYDEIEAFELKEELSKQVLDIDTDHMSGINAFKPGYIDKKTR